MKMLWIIALLLGSLGNALAQDYRTDSMAPAPTPLVDSALRIINLNPFFTLHVDSTLEYDLEINRPEEQYYWYTKNAPIGLKLNRTNGKIFLKAEKSYFKSGRLKYDQNYQVELGVQNLQNPNDKVDTAITIVFYSTEINASKLKPTIGGTVQMEEGDTIQFAMMCEDGTFPIEQITMLSNIPINNYQPVKRCDDVFHWFIPYDFIRDGDTAKQKNLVLQFIGADKFFNKDTAMVRFTIKPGINYPEKYAEHARLTNEVNTYILQLKLTFKMISDNVKKNKSTRTTFDIAGSSTALAGTILATSAESESAQNVGKVLPSVGLTLVPVKEAVAPNKIQEQNTAAQVRAVANRLEYLRDENSLRGDRDPLVLDKTKKLSDELRQAKLQLVDLPMVEFSDISPEEAERYFRDPKVNKKYKLKLN